MQLSGSWTAVLPSGQVSGAFTIEVPSERIADAIATRVAAMLEPSQHPAQSRYVDFPPADVNAHRHAVRFSPDPDQLYGEVDQ